ncbi:MULTISPECIES: Rrf2 family transcriptional regulator [unclassified Moritella]|uniref:Rrf2 family transcriptional regulator n=1 Tax=unclassified Moritella TaxID=2637987 RepID=UPI001BA981C0|nr:MULTISPECIES: Rrf2 family transcriptional regulator [unclassified Moritella]QUM82284.1 Rrf2 family transcriptional regulator [Moritella sp. 5]QUM86584.1 Rrf2 family transcriptional regulator [Moritella sp. 28]QUM90812.1 Rrf2 family transcriptional regulator [Moritella sp. 36]
MQLNRYTDYGLRLLTYLAVLPDGQKVSIDEISKIYDLSRNHINKIVHQLGKEGIIETKRGKGGGFYLSRTPESLNLADIVILLESSMEIINCTSPSCRISPVCNLNSILSEATTAFIDSLKQYTLADLIKDNRQQLIQVLEIGSF